MSAWRALSPRRQAMSDQAHAASRHAGRLVRNLAASDRDVALVRMEMPFLDEPIELALTSFTRGEAVLCEHVRPDRPAVLHVAAHVPTALRCLGCLHSHALAGADPEQDTTCDRCGDELSHVHPGVMQAGALLVTFALCAACTVAVRAEAGAA